MRVLSIISLLASSVALTAYATAGLQVKENGIALAPPAKKSSAAADQAGQLSLSVPFYTNSIADSDFLTGRAAVVKAGATAFDFPTISFDYSGVTVAGTIVQYPNSTQLPYSIYATFSYPCIPGNGDATHGNLVAVIVNEAQTDVIDLGSDAALQTCGGTPTRFSLKGATDLTAITSVSLVKLTEPAGSVMWDVPDNNIQFHGFDVTTAADQRKFYGQYAPFYHDAKALRMEVIGDSITCGYMINCRAIPNDASTPIYRLEDVSAAYPSLACASLGAKCSYVAWSGRGMAYNYFNSPDSHTVPFLYNYTQATVIGGPSTLWNFADVAASPNKPHAVMINLGTNDFSNPNIKEHIETFIATYADFLRQVVAHYGPKTQIVNICGPIFFDACPYVQQAISRATGSGYVSASSVYFLQLDSVLNSANTCANHPDAAISKVIAKQVEAFMTSKVIPNVQF